MFGIYIALRRGNPWYITDDEIMIATLGQYVHCEIIVVSHDNKLLVSFGAWENETPSFQMRDPTQFIPGNNYTFFRLPIDDINKIKQATTYLVTLARSNLQYQVGWECVIPRYLTMLIDRNDVNVQTHPRTWKKVFCSQIVLLFVKKCVVESILPSAEWAHIMTLYSRSCSPSDIFELCTSAKLKEVTENEIFLR